MQLLNVTNLPLYLPGDAAFTPFGDPFSDATATHASPAVFSVPGYEPVNGDTMVLSPGVTGGKIPGGFSLNTQYFVVGSSGGTFELSATKGGGAISSTSTGGTFTVHLTANDAGIQNIPLPFKPGNTVAVFNFSGGSLVLQGAPDVGGGYGDPQGPGSYSTIATVAATSGALAQLSYDWIRVSTSATLVLLQN